MDLLIWPAAALFILAVILRSGKRRDGIDWMSRTVLLLLSTAICLLFDQWIRVAALNAAEAAATTAVAASGFAIAIRPHYEAVLSPLYIVIVAVAIDVLARLTRRYVRAQGINRSGVAVRDLSANLLLFVAVPALPYAWTAYFAPSSSIIGHAAREVLMPVIATYGAPAHWLRVASNDAWIWQRLAESSWPWNPGYRSDSYLSLHGFLTDSMPWMALAIVMSCIALARNKAPPRKSVSDYFVAPKTSTQAGLLTRVVLGPWRGRVTFAFTVLWTVPLLLWLSFVVLTLSLSYVLLWLIVFAIVGAVAGAIFLVVRSVHRGNGKTPNDT